MTTLPKYTYLYGFTKKQITALSTQPYAEAIQTKIDAAKALNVRLHDPDFMSRDSQRIQDVNRAIKFNKELLEELK